MVHYIMAKLNNKVADNGNSLYSFVIFSHRVAKVLVKFIYNMLAVDDNSLKIQNFHKSSSLPEDIKLALTE